MRAITPPHEPRAQALGETLARALGARDRTAAEEALRELGAASPAPAAATLLDLARRPPLEHCVLALAREWDLAADPEMALRGFERLAAEPAAAEALADLGDARAFTALHALLGGSAFLTSLLARHPEWLRAFLVDVLEPGPISADDMRRRALAWLAREGDLDRALRFLKGEIYLRIAARDLAGMAPLDETVLEITHLAEALLGVAVAEIQRTLELEHGAPASPEPAAGEAPPGFVVLGMGKLGGRELNFSSDIDLIYLFHSDREETLGNREGEGQIPVGTFFAKLGERLTQALSRSTDDGFAMRVDLRLRPMGTSGAVAHSLRNALLYYEAYGRTWERAALLKARPVAGNRALGEAFLKAVEPFVYRRYLDYSTVEDMKEMKRRIDVGLAPGGEHIRNVKLGKGGIREIEFVVQTLALINAGKDRRIRVRGALEALPLLAAHGYLSTEDHDRLHAAYVFLRHVEHRIQIVTERQSHRLPTDREEMRNLARRMGYRSGERGDLTDAFALDLETHRAAVSAIFRTFFHEAEGERTRRVRPEVRALFDTPDLESVTNAQLAQLGFDDLAAARRALGVLRDGPPKSPTTGEAKARLDRVAPLLMEEAASSPQPDLALANLERFLQRSGARSAYLSLLAENPTITRLLMRLMSSSVFLSEILIAHPELIDGLIRAGASGPLRSRDELAGDLAERLRQADDEEEVFEALRVFRTEETLRIGFHDVIGNLELEALTAQLSDVAEVCLAAALDWTLEQTTARYGRPMGEDRRPARFGVLGLGKLGGREIQYGSDLDLIFLYDPPGATEGRDRTILNGEFFAKLAQRLITTLSAVTASGIVYPIDVRLRPSGNAGPLVTSLDSFRRYHEREAALWERQSLIKARVVAGDAGLAAEAAAIRDHAVYGRGITVEEVAEIRRMRSRMELERARQVEGAVDLKLGPGGLVDVEFAVQVLLLRHGHAHPLIRHADTLGALEAIALEALLSPTDTEALSRGYLFLRRIENRQRIVHDRATDLFPLDGPELEALASRLDPDGALGLPNTPAALRDEFLRVTAEVRRVYDAITAGPD
ncbi:MAG: bifunctional [glutamate--ammonia ligase]-adenylyl-L-tyrosine phosphorylase/[glutamate--ammonia-ligase] adenylyltransferase [bacterium]